MKKDFSRPRIVIAQPTRNTDGAFRNEPYLASNELKFKNISPGPVPSLDMPLNTAPGGGGGATERQRTEPRMRQYGLNMITNTIQDPEQMKSNNEVAKAQLKKRLIDDQPPGPGQYDPLKKPPLGGSPSPLSLETIAELKRGKDKSLLSKLGIQENLLSKKGLAFNSTSPRFQSESSRNMHNRNRTINGDDM